MSSMSSVAGLSKYIRTLPPTNHSIIYIILISFITGSFFYILNPHITFGIIESIIIGGLFGLTVLGISSIMSGSTGQFWVNTLHGINLKQKHSMFLALLSMILVGFIMILGATATRIFNMDLIFNSIIFGCVIGFGINILVLWATSSIGFGKSVIIGSIQPILILAMYTLIAFFFNTEEPTFGILSTLKIIIAALIFVVAIYSFISVINSPMKRNLGIGVLDLLSLFIAHMNEGSKSLEYLFENISESIETLVTFTSFKSKDGIKALFVSPSVHPGPLGDIGGSNMPTILANRFNNFTMIAHGPSTHDFNPVSTKEIDKIEDAIKKGLKNVKYESKASKFLRYKSEKAKIGVQFFNEGMVILSTFSPEGSDDIEFGVGLTMMIESKHKCNVKDSIIVDCHNSFTKESGEVLPGNPEVFQLLDSIDKIDSNVEKYPIKVGCYSDEMKEFDKSDAIGDSGIKTLVIEVDNQKTAYLLFDSNNMEIGFREEIIEAVKDLDIDEIEVMTTDTHSVNTLSRGYNPIGITKRKEIIEFIKKSIKKSIEDLEEVEVGTGTELIKDLKTFGPNNSTELISTISSIVSISKIMAPLIFITSIFIVIIWIFYLGA